MRGVGDIAFVLADGGESLLSGGAPGGLRSLLALVRALAARRTTEIVRLRVFSFGGPEAGPEEPRREGALGAVAAWLRSVRAELPWLTTSMVVDRRALGRASDVVRDELRALGLDEEVAYTEAGRCVPLLAPLAPSAPTSRIERGGLYLVTGGLGGVGRLLAEHLLRRYDAKLLLVGRRPLAEGDEGREALRRLEALGSVVYHAADAADLPALRRARRAAEERFGAPLRGAFHLAGVLGGGPAGGQSFDQLAAVLRPKVDGTNALARLVADRAPGLLVLFSSLTGVFGGAGVAAHAAASGYQERFARAAAAATAVGSSLAIYSIAWSTWRQTGQSRDRADAQLAATRGYVSLDAERALRLFEAVLARPPGAYVAGIDANVPNVAWQYLRAPRCYASTSTDGARPPAVPPAAPAPLPAADASARIRGVWGEVLKLEEVRDDENFFDLGGHSLVVPQVVERLNGELGVGLEPVDLFRYSTVRALAGRVRELLPGTSREVLP